MIPNKASQEKFNTLRRQAEKLLAATPSLETDGIGDGPLKLIHELQTYQIELELQNEELHRSQQQLMKSQMRYTELYDFAPVGYITLNLKGRILNANLTLADMLAVERSSLINQPLSAHIVFEDQDIYFRHIRDLSDTRMRQVCELRMKKTDGTVLDVQLESTVSSLINGQPKQYQTVAIDISAQKKMRREHGKLQAQLYQAHKMKSISTIAGGVAHDFNNILYIIVGNVELAMEGIPKWNPVHSNLEVIKASVLRATGIVKQLLNFSRKSRQEQKPTGVVSAIKDTLKFLRASISTTIEITTGFPDAEVMILANSIQIGQVLMNLCTNASQAMEETGGTLEIKVKTQFLTQGMAANYPGLKSGDYVKIKVSDNGPGINPEFRDQIFDPYFTTKAVGKGSGMGLAVVHGIVRNHNGAISVESRPGKGASFTMLFPMIDAEPETNTETINSILHGTETVLFIDDEEYITELAQTALTLFGYRVDTMTDPNEALALFKSNPGYFDVVVTDMTMPKMTGATLVKRLMEIRPDIPVIISTGHSALIDEEKARQIGIADYVMKPVSMSTIAKSIRKIMDSLQ
jgi:PAS domain S-box-containing protein